MTNEERVAAAEFDIQHILLELEQKWEGPPVSVQSVDVDTRNFSQLKVTIEMRDGLRE